MAQKKKYRVTQRSATRATSEFKRSIKKVNWKLLLTVVGLTVGLTTVYQVCMHFEVAWIMWVYYAALILSALGYIITNRGISRDIPTREQLRDDMDDAQKDEFIETIKTRRNKAKKFLIIVIPLLFNFIFEIIYVLYYPDFIKPMLESIMDFFTVSA